MGKEREGEGEREEARPRRGMRRERERESALARPQRNWGKRWLFGWSGSETRRAGNYSWSLGVCVASSGKTAEVLPTVALRELGSSRQ